VDANRPDVAASPRGGVTRSARRGKHPQVTHPQDDPGSVVPLSEPDLTFDVSWRGYDQRQVADAIADLQERLHAAETQAAAGRAAHEGLVEEHRRLMGELAQARRGAAPEPTFEALGERVGQILALARDEAAAIRHAATAEVEPARRAALEEAERLRAEAGAEAARRLADARATAATLEEEARAQRRAGDLAVETERRRAESDALSVRSNTRKEADELLATARREAEEQRAAARAEVAELEAKRDQVKAGLTRLRDALGLAVGGSRREDEPEAASASVPAAATDVAPTAEPEVGWHRVAPES